MKMTPREAINAATLNGAYAMGLQKTRGSITAGKRADLFISKKVPSLEFLPYAYGTSLTSKVILGGKIVFEV
jgi:imidazolonepropionase